MMTLDAFFTVLVRTRPANENHQNGVSDGRLENNYVYHIFEFQAISSDVLANFYVHYDNIGMKPQCDERPNSLLTHGCVV